jgi:mannose/fructose/sorbose-specific phosphotransferase system IIA component
MIGMVLIAHAHIASEMKQAIEHVLGEQPLLDTVDVLASEHPDNLQAQLEACITQCDHGDGVLIFADMLGGTPCNIALGCLKHGQCEVISGFNLPLLIKAVSQRSQYKKGHVDLTAFAKDIVQAGKQYMTLQTDLLPSQAHNNVQGLSHA